MHDLDLIAMHRRRARTLFGWGAVLAVAGLALIARGAWAQVTSGTTMITVAQVDPTTDQLMALINFCGGAFQAGEYFAGLMALIVVLVMAVRLFGKRVHDLIPDDHWADKPFFWLFDTKPGGIVLNALTASAVVLAPALLSGVKMTGALVGATLLAGVGASQMWGWLKDLHEWWKTKQPAKPAEPPVPTPPAGGAP